MHEFMIRYPAIFQMTGYFADCDLISDNFEEIAREFQRDCGPDQLQDVLLEIALLMADSIRFEAFSDEINIRFESDEETVAFLRMIKSVLESDIQADAYALSLPERTWSAPSRNHTEAWNLCNRDAARLRDHFL